MVAGDRPGKTWFFRIAVRSDPWRGQYFFFFARHFWHQDGPRHPDRLESRVGLLVSEAEGPGRVQGERLADDDITHPLSLREVFLAESGLCRKRIDRVSNGPVWVEAVDAGAIARDFLKELVLGRVKRH